MSTEYKAEINEKYDNTSSSLIEKAPSYVKAFYDKFMTSSYSIIVSSWKALKMNQ